MSLTVSGVSNSFEPLPTGTYDAVCFAVAAIGPVRNQRYGKVENKVYLGFQVEHDGELHDIWTRQTQSIGAKATLGKMLRSWRGKDFTPEELREFQLVNILGVPALLIVEQRTSNSGKVYSNVKDILPPKKKVQAEETWAFDSDDPAKTNYDKLPKFIQNEIEAAAADLGRPAQAPTQTSSAAGNSSSLSEASASVIDDLPF